MKRQIETEQKTNSALPTEVKLVDSISDAGKLSNIVSLRDSKVGYPSYIKM